MLNKNILALACFFILLFTVNYSDEAVNRKIIITTQEWKPYSFKMENGQAGGIATEVVKKVLDEMNVKYEIEVYPWERAQIMVKAGDADAFFAASRNAERDSYAVMSDVIAPQKWYWYLDKESKLDPASPDFIKEAKVLALFGSNMLKYLEDKKYNIGRGSYSMDNIVMILDAGRIDAVLVNDIVITEYFKTNKINPAKYKKVLCQSNPLGIYFSKKFLNENKGFLERFNKILKKHTLQME